MPGMSQRHRSSVSKEDNVAGRSVWVLQHGRAETKYASECVLVRYKYRTETMRAKGNADVHNHTSIISS